MTSESPTPWEALEALAAGELPAAEARALHARIAAEPALRDPWRQVRQVEALLREAPLLPLPLALVNRTLAQVLAAKPARPWHVLGRAAAAVLVFTVSWLAFSGTPALAHARPATLRGLAPRPEVVGALPHVSARRATVLPRPTGALDALGCAAAGLALVAAGVLVSWPRGAARGGLA